MKPKKTMGNAAATASAGLHAVDAGVMVQVDRHRDDELVAQRDRQQELVPGKDEDEKAGDREARPGSSAR